MLIIEKKFSPKIKSFFTLLIVVIFSIIVILNSNLKNKNVNKGKNAFETIISGRSLEEVEAEGKGSTKICEKTSDTLKKYYKTGEKSILGIDDDNIKGEKGEYIDALIKIIKKIFSKKEKEINSNNNRNLFELNELKDEEYLNNLITYGKHILPLVVIFAIAILSFPGWFCCICLCCCKCCCCCCKKPGCRIPSFVFSYIFYGIVALVCFYALGKSNSIFVGIADTECSILKFVDEVVDGESKENPPYWAGIDNITKILDELSTKISSMNSGTTTTLNNAKNNVDSKKQNFEQNLKDGGDKIINKCTSTTGCSDYYATYNGKEYQLDMANKFGKYDTTSKEATPENSICDLWLNEYKTTAKNADDNFVVTKNSFNEILTGTSVSESLSASKKSIKEIKESFDEIKLIIADNIIKHADNIDKNGKLIFKILYFVLILMDAGIAVFMLLLCFCSGRLCSCCCCCRCFCKIFIHVLWNLMAICMIGLFLFGSIFTISGKVGEDMISVVAYLVSEDNLGENSDTILFGEVKKYLNKCFNYDGDISTELGFTDSMNNFPKLKNAELQLEDIEQEFKDKTKKFVYTEYLEELNKKVSYSSEDLKMVETNPDPDNPSPIKFTDLITSINSKAASRNENWDITSETDNVCSTENRDESAHESLIKYHPKKCYPTDKTWITSELFSNNEVTKLEDFKKLINLANDDDAENSIRKILGTLNTAYVQFLNAEIQSIKTFKETIEQITNIVSKVSGEEEGIFSFINCKFIKSNTQIILVNLKNAFGEELYMVGVYLLMAAFSLAFAIFFTILLTVILNMNVDNNKREGTKAHEDIPEYPMNSEGRYIKNEKI